MTLQPRLGRVSLKIDFQPDQTLSSFLSALAAINGMRSSARFCKGFGLDYAGLCSGNVEAILGLADLAGVDAAQLAQASTVVQPRGYVHGSQLLDRNQLRPSLHVCPLCLENDGENHPNLPLEAATWERASWRHSWVNVCLDHHMCVVELPCVLKAHSAHDLSVLLRNLYRSGQVLARVTAEPSRVETYIQMRYRGVSQCPVLDGMPLSDALAVALYLGSPHNFATPKPKPRDHDHVLQWADAGLSIAALGWVAVREHLEKIGKVVNPHGACEIGLLRVFKSLFKRLNVNSDPATLPLRQMLVEIGVEQNLFPFDQTMALGLPLPPRSLQSLESARRRFGISERILRAILDELGIAMPTNTERPGNATLVDLEQFAPLLRELKDCLNLKQAARALGLMPMQLIKLSDHSGVLQPFFTRSSADLKPLRYFRKSDLSNFLANLTAGSQRVRSSADLVNVWEAGLRTCRQPTEVIAAIHDGRIGRTYRLGSVRTVKDLMVNVEDVRLALAEENGDDLVSAEDCARSLSVNILAARKIMKSGMLVSEASINPINRRRQLAVRQAELAHFNDSFISLTAVRKQWGTTAPGMAIALTRAGVTPAFPLKQTMVGIYRRRDVEKAKRKIEAVMGEREAKYSHTRRMQ